MLSYCNEFEPFAAQWLINLSDERMIAQCKVDVRSIKEVTADDVRHYQQCHYFAGIGGWPLALRLAGWADASPVWTGSCPCQPFSAAGKRKGEADERHLWPEFFRLIRECKPPTIFGEQVASKDGLTWLDGVFADLEGAGYACGAADLCAAGFGAPHIRQRLFWVAYTEHGRPTEQEPGPQLGPQSRGVAGRLAFANGTLLQREPSARQQPLHQQGDGLGGLGDTGCEGLAERISERGVQCGEGVPGSGQTVELRGPWSDYRIVHCTDGKARRVSSQPGDEPLAYGIPMRVGPMLARLEGMERSAIKAARRNRVGRLKGYGNAIVPIAAAEFVRAFMERMEA